MGRAALHLLQALELAAPLLWVLGKELKEKQRPSALTAGGRVQRAQGLRPSSVPDDRRGLALDSPICQMGSLDSLASQFLSREPVTT